MISQLLHEQSTLTAAEEFSTWHKTHTEPEQAQYYRNLMPATMPQAGQQLAFEVDLDKCSGCKACVVACHSLNGLDEGESFRDVGLLLAPSQSLALSSLR
jgi:NAD-dependent dihydropyrimidine dehydrogenase PreA subunit